jgi:hypothetical protein
VFSTNLNTPLHNEQYLGRHQRHKDQGLHRMPAAEGLDMLLECQHKLKVMLAPLRCFERLLTAMLPL